MTSNFVHRARRWRSGRGAVYSLGTGVISWHSPSHGVICKGKVDVARGAIPLANTLMGLGIFRLTACPMKLNIRRYSPDPGSTFC